MSGGSRDRAGRLSHPGRAACTRDAPPIRLPETRRRAAGGFPAAVSHSDTDRGLGKASREFRACGGGLAIPGNRSGPGNRQRRIRSGAHPPVVADLADHAAPVPSAECGGGVPPERVTSRPPRVGGTHPLSPRRPRRHPVPSGYGRRVQKNCGEYSDSHCANGNSGAHADQGGGPASECEISPRGATWPPTRRRVLGGDAAGGGRVQVGVYGRQSPDGARTRFGILET